VFFDPNYVRISWIVSQASLPVQCHFVEPMWRQELLPSALHHRTLVHCCRTQLRSVMFMQTAHHSPADGRSAVVVLWLISVIRTWDTGRRGLGERSHCVGVGNCNFVSCSREIERDFLAPASYCSKVALLGWESCKRLSARTEQVLRSTYEPKRPVFLQQALTFWRLMSTIVVVPHR